MHTVARILAPKSYISILCSKLQHVMPFRLVLKFFLVPNDIVIELLVGSIMRTCEKLLHGSFKQPSILAHPLCHHSISWKPACNPAGELRYVEPA